jgi:hypothetical protein
MSSTPGQRLVTNAPALSQSFKAMLNLFQKSLDQQFQRNKS